METRHRKAEDSGLDRLIPLIDVKRVLAVSFPTLVGLIRDGRLTAFDVTGRTVDRQEVNEHSRGLRVFESELERFIETIKIR